MAGILSLGAPWGMHPNQEGRSTRGGLEDRRPWDMEGMGYLKYLWEYSQPSSTYTILSSKSSCTLGSMSPLVDENTETQNKEAHQKSLR